MNHTHGQVAILLCTMNGEAYLAEQMDSFERQTHGDWALWVSDDGSSDRTLQILDGYCSRWTARPGMVEDGPRKGFAANFLSLVCNPQISGDYYAYSDQDDIWEPEKIARALQWLGDVPQGIPALYCGRTELVDAGGAHIGHSTIFGREPGFRNALTQNIGGGNTMVFNAAARELLVEAGPDVAVIAHDWWTYLVVSGCSGRVFFDPAPTLRYRQHDRNLIGANHTFVAPFMSIRRLFEGKFRNWNDRNISALQRLAHRLSPDSRNVLSTFSAARHERLPARLLSLRRSGVYRQTLLGNMGLLAAAVLNRI